MNNQRTIIELEAQISALKKQLKNIAQESNCLLYTSDAADD